MAKSFNVPINVDCDEIKTALEKAKKLAALLEEANTLAGELASDNITVYFSIGS